ncbi:MAG: S1 family peptidase [Solirubrobacterales bacterium]
MTAWGDLRARLTLGALTCLLVALLAPSTAAAAPTAQASIVGGHASSIAEFPSLAFIEARQGRHGFACTGTVVAPRVVLTAAHCVESIEHGGLTPPGQYAVATNVTKPEEATAENIFRVIEAHVFTGFDPGRLHGDAGILILDRPTTAPPLPLAGPGDAALYEGGATVQLAGWGLTRANAREEPAGLRSTSMLVETPQGCKQKTRGFYKDFSPAIQLCTLDPARRSGGCFGDSGGPAIAQRPDGTPVEVGVISSGAELCSTKQPNVLTRVDYVSTWVSEWIAATEAGGPRPVLAPNTPLPVMTKPSAEAFAVFTLQDNFGNRFVRAKRILGSCKRSSTTRFSCEIAWFVGPYVYAGKVTPFYLRRDNSVIWNSHFQVRWAVLSCLRKKSHHCAIHSKRG